MSAAKTTQYVSVDVVLIVTQKEQGKEEDWVNIKKNQVPMMHVIFQLRVRILMPVFLKY